VITSLRDAALSLSVAEGMVDMSLVLPKWSDQKGTGSARGAQEWKCQEIFSGFAPSWHDGSTGAQAIRARQDLNSIPEEKYKPLKKINIGGVPEHFNLPWLDAIEQFDARAERFQWCPQPQGTGAMVEALDGGALDVAVMLTEGAVAARASGSEFDIEHTYVESPLQWGIHVPARAAVRDEASIRGLRYAISRRGSGSHLMSCAHALMHGWPIADIEFVVVGTIDGAVQAFREQRADVFFWERYMTAPLVAAGEFRRVGIFEAPWPAFVVCLARRLDDERRVEFAGLYARVMLAAQAFVADPSVAAARLGRVFGIEHTAALEWLAHTRWASSEGTDSQSLHRVAEVLLDAGLIAAIPSF